MGEILGMTIAINFFGLESRCLILIALVDKPFSLIRI